MCETERLKAVEKLLSEFTPEQRDRIVELVAVLLNLHSPLSV